MQDRVFPEATADKQIARGLMGLSQALTPEKPSVFHLVATAEAMNQLGLAAYVGVRRMIMGADTEGRISFLYAEGLVLSDGVAFDLDDNVDWLEIANARLDEEETTQSYYFESQFVDQQGSMELIQEQADMGLFDFEAALAQGVVLVSARRAQQLDRALRGVVAPTALKPRM